MTSRKRTALQKHVDFFDSDRDGKITFLETYQGLRRLGLGAARSVVKRFYGSRHPARQACGDSR